MNCYVYSTALVFFFFLFLSEDLSVELVGLFGWSSINSNCFSCATKPGFGLKQVTFSNQIIITEGGGGGRKLQVFYFTIFIVATSPYILNLIIIIVLVPAGETITLPP